MMLRRAPVAARAPCPSRLRVDRRYDVRCVPSRSAHFRVGIAPGFGASPLIFQSFSRKPELKDAVQETVDEIQSRRKNYAHMSSAVDLSKPPGLILMNSSAHHFAEFEKITSFVPEAMHPGLLAYQKFQDALDPLVCTTAVYLPHDTNDKIKIQPFQLDVLPPPSAHHISFWVQPGNRRFKDKLLRDSSSLRVAVECAGNIIAAGQNINKGAAMVHYADPNQDWFAKLLRMHFGHEYHKEVYRENDLEFGMLLRKQIFMPKNLLPSSILDQFTPRFVASADKPTVIAAKKPPGLIPTVLPMLNLNLKSIRFGLFPNATLYQQEMVFSNLALCVVLKEAFESRSYLLLADPTYPMAFVASVTHMFVHLVPERGSPQAHLRLEYVISPQKRCRIVSVQSLPEGFGAQQAEVEFIEDEPVFATAEVETLRKRIMTSLEGFFGDLAETYDKERLEELKTKLNSVDHANFSWLVASVLSSRPFQAGESAAKEWIECLSVPERYGMLVSFLENYRKRIPPAPATPAIPA